MKSRASFLTSAADPRGFPPADLPEIAFAGRSNVGKSSLINRVVGATTALARTSSAPGRTRLLNWFRVEPPKGKPIAFVDLPGYGYAKVPMDMRESWRPLIEAYLTGRSVLKAVVVLIDARRGVEDEERDLVEWLGASDVPVIVVLTKIDKLAKNKRQPVAAIVRRELGMPRDPVQVSAQTGEGIDDLWRVIQSACAPPKRGAKAPAAAAPPDDDGAEG
jgi:GTP-binding protein